MTQIELNDIIIAVMGVTGAGKSTFIQQFTKENVGIGDSLLSYTSVTTVFKCSTPKIPCFYLVDTPGFDDSKKSDTDILGEVADWLSRAYHDHIKLSGIIYLHRISDVRVGGSGVKNLRMFRELCGENGHNAMACVALVTTFWGGESKETGDRREYQLKTSSSFWSQIIAKGGKVFRHDQGVLSGERIISYLVGRKETMTLEIQRDMVDRGKKLEDTGAGRVVQEELNKLKAEHARELERIRNEWKEALDTKDEEWQKEIKAYKAEIEQKMREDEIQREKLRADDAALRQQIEEEREEETRAFLEEMRENERRIKEYQAAIEKSQRLDQEVMQDLKKELERQKELTIQYRREAGRLKCIVM
ncbi:hypothetical protein N431DRAFT_560827 [Stipitochalara longipes BDJ]|nr:hypothetical protein N431DRAFT_560827 [Stipitochalara longipes BDJ]